MGFQPLVIKKASVGTGVNAVLRKRQQGDANLVFNIRTDLGTGMNWSDGDKLEVQLGTEGQHGLIRLRKNNSFKDGADIIHRKAGAKKSYFSVSLGHISAFVNRAESSKWCKFEMVEGGYIEIVLPKWADETAPGKKPAPIAATEPKRIVQEPVRQPVTANLMGDPPPGRRQMLDKVGKIDLG